MAIIDKKYHNLLKEIIKNGYEYEDSNRKGVRRKEINSYIFKHDFKDGFPAITTKKLFWKGVVGELLWFLRGDTNIEYLIDNGIHIWDKDSKKFSDNGECGRIYGAQWVKWHDNFYPSVEAYSGEHITVNQIDNLIKEMKSNPMSTQLIVTAWNPAELDKMALPPCHYGFIISCRPLSPLEMVNVAKLEGKWEQSDQSNFKRYGFYLKWSQRSVDTFLGLPFNIASYALLAQILGKLTNTVPLGIIGNLTNVHIYDEYFNVVKEQLNRDINKYKACELSMSENVDEIISAYENKKMDTTELFNNLQIEDFKLEKYNSFGQLKTKMIERD